MKKLSTANIFLYGAGSLGIEIAKNIVLAGIKSLTLMDFKNSGFMDLGNQFFINDNHVQNSTNRAIASLDSLKELNPYVKINCIDRNLEDYFTNNNEQCIEFLSKFNCVILTEINLDLAVKINEVCRLKCIHFIMTDVNGLFGWSFIDFGENFQVIDSNGEECKEGFIGNITQENEYLVIETLEKRLHNLESGDYVRLSEIEGLNELNDKIFEIKVINPTKFALLKSHVQDSQKYLRGGVYKEIKQPKILSFQSLKEQLYRPSLTISNYAKMMHPYLTHVSYLAIKQGPKSIDDFINIVQIEVNKLNEKLNDLNLNVNAAEEKFFKIFFNSAKGIFHPLNAIFGGLIAQEALKSITNKFTPIKQWFHLDYVDLYENSSQINLKNDKYDSLRYAFGGENTLNRLMVTKLFMVGCGAIGCEMIKNYAALGIACGNSGLVTITDNDLIEKSNLNRQFLFRQTDLQKPKSETAARSALKINSDVKINSLVQKVCPQTEKDIFNDKFFSQQDVCVNALDNLEARRYMDSRCVSNQKALLESGTLGAKGHVQVIVPFLTESYTSTRDPQDEDIPYCTLKSFPSNIEHCIEWSRDKFESSFTIKPNMYRNFLIENPNITQLIEKLEADENIVIDGIVKVAKILRSWCYDWNDCVKLSRNKFEKYYSNKAKNLMYCYPLDCLLSDGTPFWKLPKRPPNAIKFNPDNELHVKFIESTSRLYADLFGVKERNRNAIKNILREHEPNVPEWRPSNKKIETDESKRKDEIKKDDDKSQLTNKICADIIKSTMYKLNLSNLPDLNILHFEKDDDSNGHIDFVYGSSNLRGLMYSIEITDRLRVKKVAGKIVPAIATTTSCIAGFVAAELVKVVMDHKQIESYNNIFLNLALPFVLLSEPGKCERNKIAGETYVTLWDKWHIRGRKDLTLKQFIDVVKQKYNLTISGLMSGVKAIYIPVMPGHKKRLNETMIKLIKGDFYDPKEDDYADLNLTYVECDEINANNLCPPIRYFYF